MNTEVWRDWSPAPDVDAVLRAQGAEPAIVRARSPRLVALAARALEEGPALLTPAVAWRRLNARGLRHARLLLEDHGALSGPLIAAQLAAAEQVIVFACTVGARLEQRVAELLAGEAAYALALDGFGSAAVEALAAAACVRFEREAAAEDACTSTPLNPGMDGWPIEVGQPEIFAILGHEPAGIVLTPAAQMRPRKSLSLVLGVSRAPFAAGHPCDFCSLRATCRFRPAPA